MMSAHQCPVRRDRGGLLDSTAMSFLAVHPPTPDPEHATKELVCDLLRRFHDLGWCTGTGGGMSVRTAHGYLMAPSGVAKERLRPEDLFELDAAFTIRNQERLGDARCSECAPLFRAIYEHTDAGAVIHSHAIPLVLATRRDPEAAALSWERLEMIKGIRGAAYPERHTVPVIANTPREAELLDAVVAALAALPPHAHAIFVRDHGAYLWGRDAREAQRHAEVYHWLCRFQQEEAR